MTGEPVTTVEQLGALPAPCVLQSAQPGYGPTYVVVNDWGDGQVMYEVAGEPGTFAAAELLEEYGPLELVWPRSAAVTVTVSDDEVRTAIGRVLFNATNFPAAVQALLLGQDMGPLTEKLTEAVAPLAAESRTATSAAPDEMFDAANDLVWLSEWIDAGNAHRDPEAITWGRLAKLAEETGEVVAAYIGLTGQNPRKGVTHTLQDVYDELLDVAVTALGAAEHLAGHQGAVLDGLLLKIHLVAKRAREVSHG